MGRRPTYAKIGNWAKWKGLDTYRRVFLLQPMDSHSVARRSALFLALLLTTSLHADLVETKNGARIVGKITRIDAGTVEVDTSFAGTIKIKQAEVSTMSTDAPVAVRLASGTRLDGKVTAAPDGSLQ